MNASIQIVYQLSKLNVWNQHNQQMERMYNGIDELLNILSCVGFAKLCYVIKNLPELNHNFVKEGITFPLPYSSRVIHVKKRTG